MERSTSGWRVGFHPVREVLRKQAKGVRRVLISARPGKRRAEIEGLCVRHGVVVENASKEVLAQFSLEVHNGFAALVDSQNVAESSGGDPELVVLLEDIQDPRNLGAILRVCEGAGVGQVLIRDRGSAPLSETVGKTSAGAMEWVETERVSNSAQAIQALQKEGYWVYGADMAGKPPWSIDLTGKVVIAMGGEANGLRRNTQSKCDALVALPMRGRVESLNVATAAAAILYEAIRQRSQEN